MGKIKYGKDQALERLANQLLSESVGDNKRGISRDVEKISYESGLMGLEDLEHYDPDNDWDTLDSVLDIIVSGVDSIEPDSADVGDGNIRARIQERNGPPGTWNRASIGRRKKLMRHVEDDDNWGSTGEEISPPLGVNKVTSGKTCTRCKLRKRLEYFSPDPRGKYGRDGWCKECRRAHMEQIRGNARSGD